MILGTAVHASLELHYRALMDGESEPGIEELVAAAVWSVRSTVSGPVPVEWEGDEGQAELEVECRRVLEAFVQKPYRPHKVLGVEVPFELSLKDEQAGVVYDEKVVGFFDMVVEDGDGGIAIVDHKVTSRLAVPKSTELDTQIGLYAWAGDQLAGKPVRLRHHVLVRNKKSIRLEVVDIPRSENDAQEAQEGLYSAMEYIHLAVDHPRPELFLGRRRSWRCSGCAYRDRCGQPR
jgi:hypothetical protein